MLCGINAPLLSAALLLVAACGGSPTDPRAGLGPPPTGWAPRGLQGDTVLTLALHGAHLYAGTVRGVFRRSLGAGDTAWTSLGLLGRRVEAVLPVSASQIVAAVRITGEGADTVSLFRTVNGGATWTSAQPGFGAGGASNEARSLARLRDGALLAGGTNFVIAKADAFPGSWRRVWGDWWLGALGVHAVVIDPVRPGVAWAGGEGGFFQPFLVRTTNRGESWSQVGPQVGGDNAHYSVAIDVASPTRVYSGMEGRVIRTVDDGSSWETVLAPPEYPYFFGLAASERHPARVYAAGAVNLAGPQPLVLHRSDDAGATWTTTSPESVTHGAVLHLVVHEEGGVEVVHLATGEGVYRYVPGD